MGHPGVRLLDFLLFSFLWVVEGDNALSRQRSSFISGFPRFLFNPQQHSADKLIVEGVKTIRSARR